MKTFFICGWFLSLTMFQLHFRSREKINKFAYGSNKYVKWAKGIYGVRALGILKDEFFYFDFCKGKKLMANAFVILEK